MVKAARPYMSLGVDDLAALAQAQNHDAGVISEIVDELSRRSTKKARALHRKLTDRPSDVPQKRARTTEDVGRTTTRESRDGEPNPRTPPPSGSSGRALSEAYELLRETFTLESEILARWGITTALPQDLRDFMFSEWRTRLAQQPGTHGRSKERLEADIERLRSESEDTSESITGDEDPHNAG